MASMEGLGDIWTAELYYYLLPCPRCIRSVKVIFREVVYLVKDESVKSGGTGEEVDKDSVGCYSFDVVICLELRNVNKLNV